MEELLAMKAIQKITSQRNLLRRLYAGTIRPRVPLGNRSVNASLGNNLSAAAPPAITSDNTTPVAVSAPQANTTQIEGQKTNGPVSESDKPATKQLSPPANEAKGKEESTKELKDAIKGSGEVLVKARSVFELFPDLVVLDRAKLTVKKRSFFKSAELMSIRIEDVLNVSVTVGPLFGLVKVSSRIVNSEPYVIGRFRRQDALKLKRVAQGYIIALERDIDCSSIPTKQLIDMLDKLGEDDHANLAEVIVSSPETE